MADMTFDFLRLDDLSYVSTKTLVGKIKDAEAEAIKQGGADLSWALEGYESYGDAEGRLVLSYKRPLNQREIDQNKKWAKAKEESERRLYEELKKRFETGA